MTPDLVQTRTEQKVYCNCLAAERGLHPVGHGGDFDDALVIEMPLPWKQGLYYDDAKLPAKLSQLRDLWDQAYEAGLGYRHRLLMIAPDAEYSREGYRRIMLFTRPQGLMARFDKVEYFVPTELTGDVIWALYQEPEMLPTFEPYRVHRADGVRDILVCTHGTIDAACSRFGYPLYKHVRDTYADEHLRVWRVSHFGGHVFAPTLMDMPTGHYWAFVDRERARQIAHYEGEVHELQAHYRGWAGVEDGFAQAAEAALWELYGWEWFGYVRSAQIITKDSNADLPQWAVVQVTFRAPGAARDRHCDVRVEVTRYIDTPHSTKSADDYRYAQYAAVSFEQLSE